MPMLAAGDDARLLWYANQAHGSGPAYTVVTVTAVRDGAAWERLALRVQKGDLQEWMRNAGRTPPRRRGQAAGAAAVVAAAGGAVRRGAGRRARARAEPLHGRHHVALRGQVRGIHRPLRRGVRQEPRAAVVNAEHPGRVSARPRQPPAPRGDPDAAHYGRRRCSNCSGPRSPPNTAPPGPGCTTRWTCATSGPAGCCGPPRGHPCT